MNMDEKGEYGFSVLSDLGYCQFSCNYDMAGGGVVVIKKWANGTA